MLNIDCKKKKKMCKKQMPPLCSRCKKVKEVKLTPSTSFQPLLWRIADPEGFPLRQEIRCLKLGRQARGHRSVTQV